MRSTLPFLLAIGTSLAAFSVAGRASADISGWAFIGGGATMWKQGSTEIDPAKATDAQSALGPSGTLTVEAGVGSRPDARFIFGGLFRIRPIFKHGTDVAFLARACTHGFQAGDWGVALDAGGFLRGWGPQFGGGFAGTVSLGMPLGFTLALQAEVGANDALGIGAVAGIDLLRLTVYRESLRKWWQNPAPAWLQQSAAAAPPPAIPGT